MKILMTGTNGFLGSNIFKSLQKSGHDVYTLSRYEFTDSYKITNLNPDIFIHCGWGGGNNYSDINNISQFDNVSNGIELLKILSSLPKKVKFIGFGSFAEYGKLSTQALETNFEQPENLYGLSKLTLKNYTKLICEQHNISWVWVRPCYVYGPGDVSSRLIPFTINQLLNKQDIILDNCDKFIDYIFIDDFVKLFCKLIHDCPNGIYNICSGVEYKLKAVLESIQNLINNNIKIQFNNTQLRTLTSDYICGNNQKILSLYDTNERLIDLESGLLTTISYYHNI
jgi:GDP-4-dehydro-6-deoxy-D-mannose reductase